MSKDWVVVGDATDSGGRVVTGSSFTDIDGKPVAREGDRAVCPVHKGTFPIVAGCDPQTIIDGRPVALDRAVLACGCRIIAAEQRHVFLDEGRDHASRKSCAQPVRTSIASGTSVRDTVPQEAAADVSEYAVQFLVRNQVTGEPLVGANYTVKLETGAVFKGLTDAEGRTETVRSSNSELASVHVTYCSQSQNVLCASPDLESCGC